MSNCHVTDNSRFKCHVDLKSKSEILGMCVCVCVVSQCARKLQITVCESLHIIAHCILNRSPSCPPPPSRLAPSTHGGRGEKGFCRIVEPIKLLFLFRQGKFRVPCPIPHTTAQGAKYGILLLTRMLLLGTHSSLRKNERATTNNAYLQMPIGSYIVMIVHKS